MLPAIRLALEMTHTQCTRPIFKISHCRWSRMFSARSRDNSIWFGVTTSAPPPLSLPASAAFTKLRSVYSTRLSSRATVPILWPAFTRFTASPLNSAVYSCFGFFNFTSPSNLPGRHTPSLGRRNSAGSELPHRHQILIVKAVYGRRLRIADTCNHIS